MVPGNNRTNDTTKNEINLLQHFKGWIIETTSQAFDSGKATFMDFRVNQQGRTGFVYVLPFSETKAIVEYTLFSESVLKNEEYENELKNYINNFLLIEDYKIIEKESGIIPMTTRKFKFYNDFIYHIGTAGGQTKASSGYTFQFIQKQSEKILDCLLQGKSLKEMYSDPDRFHFYDRVLLDVLCNNRVSGKEIFTSLFRKNKPQVVLRFLDNESSVIEELKIVSTLPWVPFIKSAFRQM
jgi:lycopene beta-cyclase